MATSTTTEKKKGLELDTRKTYSTSDFGSKSGINSLNIDPEKPGVLGNTSILSMSGVPELHKRLADNYVIIKKIFGFPVVQCKISDEEKDFLSRYDFNVLERSTAKQVNEEISFLKKWSNSKNVELQFAADTLINIRSKELKYLVASTYVDITSDSYDGYKALESYFERISKYNEKKLGKR